MCMCSKMHFFTSCFIVGLLVGLVHNAKLPNYITPCVRTKPDFQKCAFDNGLKAIPFILKGDKSFKVPPLVPLKIPQVSLEPNNNLKITLNDLEINGLETSKLKDILFDFDKKVIKVSLYHDYLTVLAQYQIDGRLLVPIRGSGPCNITIENVNINYELNFDVVQKSGKDYLEMKKDKLQLRSEKAHYKLENLFGNQQLSDETNRILNENALEVGKELNGPVTETIRSIVTQLIKNYLTNIPFDEIFLKE